jgi:putative Holliday junction resolvase
VSGRLLGIDLGAKRIGLAVADAGIGIARPLATVNRAATLDADSETIGSVCREQDVRELVVGLPVEARGNEGEMAAGAREWAAGIGERLGLPVCMRDERLSSFVAEGRLGRMPRGRSGGPPSRTQRNTFRARIDREAASIILQDELDARRFPVTPAGMTPAGVAPAGLAPVAAPLVPYAQDDGQEER